MHATWWARPIAFCPFCGHRLDGKQEPAARERAPCKTCGGLGRVPCASGTCDDPVCEPCPTCPPPHSPAAGEAIDADGLDAARREWLRHERAIGLYVYERITAWRAAGRPWSGTYFTAGLERDVARMLEEERREMGAPEANPFAGSTGKPAAKYSDPIPPPAIDADGLRATLLDAVESFVEYFDSYVLALSDHDAAHQAHFLEMATTWAKGVRRLIGRAAVAAERAPAWRKEPPTRDEPAEYWWLRSRPSALPSVVTIAADRVQWENGTTDPIDDFPDAEWAPCLPPGESAVAADRGGGEVQEGIGVYSGETGRPFAVYFGSPEISDAWERDGYEVRRVRVTVAGKEGT